MKCSRQAALTVIAVLGLTSFALAPAAAGAGWGYTSADGEIPPVDWGEVSHTCQYGHRQSPVAISTFGAYPGDGMEAPHLDYRKADLVVFNNGHTIEAEVEEGKGEIEIDGKHFELLQFHVHWPSEHFVDGVETRAEIHLVHADSKGNLAVLGSMLVKGNKSSQLDPFFVAAKKLPHKGDEVRIRNFDLDRLVPPGNTGFYHYTGSLTTPPCSQGVSWWVWDTSSEISLTQIKDLLVGIPRSHNPEGNRRPVQSLNGRKVYHVGN